MVLWTCQICYANEQEPFQYRCETCRTTYRSHILEKDDPSNLEAHHKQVRRLRQKVQMIGRIHHNGIKFQDPTFKRNYSEVIKRWCRPRKIYTPADPYRKYRWNIYHNPDMLDIEQRYFDNCWLVAAISSVASKPHFACQLVVSGDWRAGVYGVTLFINGGWFYVIIDNRIPCIDKYCIPTTMEVNSKQLWPFLVEKALAKFNGSYEGLEDGCFQMGMTHLTGCGCQTLDIEKAEMTEREFFDILAGKLKQGFLCQFKFLENEKQQRGGVYSSHSYQVLDAQDFEGGRLLVKIRNPWGHGSWTGKWNQRDKESWSTIPEKFKHIEKGPNHMGIFWMHVKDVLGCVSMFATSLIRERWIENACNGRIYDQGQQSIYTHKLRITQPTKVDLFLWENDLLNVWRSHKTYYKLFLQKKEERKFTFISSTNTAQSCYAHSLSEELEPGTYYVHLFTNRIHEFDEGASYTMRSLSDNKVKFKSVSISAEKLAELIIQVAMVQGKCIEGPNIEGEIYTLDHQTHSFDAIVAINNTPDHCLVIMTSAPYEQDEKHVPSRGSLITQDFIQPFTAQVLNTIGCLEDEEYNPKIFAKYCQIEVCASECDPPLTQETWPVHHFVEF